MTLPANSTFLPVLDDLLSPDFRPTLQTPVTPADVINRILATENGISSVNQQRMHRSDTFAVSTEQQQAAVKIQNWWKKGNNANSNNNGEERSRRSSIGDLNELKTVEAAKHSIRHNRTEDHVRYLESEVQRLKTALTTERKMRTLQVDAIRSLWGQVQKLSLNGVAADGTDNIMAQSMPNGLQTPNVSTKCYNKNNVCGANNNRMMSASFTAGVAAAANEEEDTFTINDSKSKQANNEHCSCSNELQNLRTTFQTEIGQLRELITTMQSGKTTEPSTAAGTSSSSSDQAQQQPQRPLTLNIVGQHQTPRKGEGDVAASAAPVAVSGYANEMATKLIEDVSVVEHTDV